MESSNDKPKHFKKVRIVLEHKSHGKWKRPAVFEVIEPDFLKLRPGDRTNRLERILRIGFNSYAAAGSAMDPIRKGDK